METTTTHVEPPCPGCYTAFTPDTATLRDTFHADNEVHHIIDCDHCQLPMEVIVRYDDPIPFGITVVVTIAEAEPV